MTVLQISPPAVEPISLAEAKQHLRVETSDEDTLIEALIIAARSHVESVTGVVMIHQEFRQFLNDIPNANVELSRYPAATINEIRTYNRSGDPNQIDVSEVSIQSAARPPMLSGLDKELLNDASNGIEIDFTAGFGLTSVDVPAPLRRAVLDLVGHWYEFRGAVAPYQQPVSVPASFEALIAPYKSVRL